ncbi:MAG: PAS domain-containing sensor histidine kinase [Myxococcota bacterium]
MPASLTDLFATALDPLAVVNPDGTIALASEGFRGVLGLDPASLLGVGLADLFHRADRDLATQTFGKVARDGSVMSLDGRVAHGDGGYRWMRWAIRRSPEGTLYVSGRDESVRRQIEKAVRLRERRNRALLDHVADVLLVVDGQLVVVDANATAAAVFGTERHVLEGRPLTELAPDLRRAPLLRLADGDGLTVETVLRTPDGRSIDVEVRAAAFSFEQERMIALLARDIRERKAHDARLRELNGALGSARDAALAASRAKTSFVTQMSHALRTPLGAILGYAELLSEDAPEPMEADLERVHAAATHLLDLVDDVLDLARIEAGRMDPASDYIELSDLLGQVADTVRPLLNGAVLDTSVTAEPPTLESDRLRVTQMLLDVLTYALRAAPTGPLALVARDHDDDHVAFEVTYDGPAPGPDAFEPFATGGREGTGGTGLGLAIARQIALGLGGSLDVSASDGRTRFTIVLRQSSET